MDHSAAARAVSLLLFDVDGVLTDGTVVLHHDGTESKTFDIKDGAALVWAQRAGLRVGILSARFSQTTVHRAAQLGITIVHQGVSSKLTTYDDILSAQGLSDAEVAYMGDDLLDLPVLRRVGLSAAPADAADDVRARVAWVSQRPGGRGAARELIELILRAQGKWDFVVKRFAESGGDA